MVNKYTSPPPNELIRGRLQVLLEHVNEVYQDGGVALEDELLSVYNEAIDIFLESLDGSITGVVFPIMKGMPADPVDYNVFTNAVYRDLEAMFYEVGAVDRLVSSNFNTIVALREQLKTMARRVAYKTADYLLYADPSLGDGFFFGDSFSSSTYLDIGSDKVEGAECFVSQEEGVVLLPIAGTPERASISKFVIGGHSNGIAGNNQQVDVLPHNDMGALGDGQPDTWFEYERVSQFAASTPLILDLTLVLSKETVINHIHIDPVMFGTPTPVLIKSIETSKDGKEYISIKDEVPIADFLSEEENDVFVLSGKASKYYGEGKFSFLPRRTKYVHVVLEQHTPYAIVTSNDTTLLRYAIGIRDINIWSRQFQPEGMLVSTPIEVGGDVTKISLWASENPIEVSTLADIRHEISVDDGASWVPVQPQGRDYLTYPEVLNFNNAESGAIDTGDEISALRHRIVMMRDPKAFTGNVTLKSEKRKAIDIVPIPGFSPFVVETQNNPIPESVTVFLPTLGSAGCPRPRRGVAVEAESAPMDLDFVQFSVDNASTNTVRYKLPWTSISNLEHHVRVFVNGEQWGYRSKTTSDLTGLDDTSRVYYLNLGGRELQFGHMDGATQKGMLPGAGARIEVCLDGDNPPMTRTDMGHTLVLMAPSDGFKQNVSIVTPTNLPDLPQGSSEAVGGLASVKIPEKTPYYNLTKHILGLKDQAGLKSMVHPIGVADNAFSFRKSATPIFGPITQTTSTSTSVNEGPVQVHLGGPDIFTYQDAMNQSQPSSPGMLPPIFDSEYGDGFFLEEFAKDIEDGIALDPGSEQRAYGDNSNDFWDDIGTDSGCDEEGYVEFVDGYSELYDGDTFRPNRWTFNPNTGVLYLGAGKLGYQTGEVLETEVRFRYRLREFKVVSISDWDFYRNQITGKQDTSRVVLSPSAVSQFPVEVIVTDSQTSATLIQDNELGHDWWNQRVVKGSVKLSSGLLDAADDDPVTPVEVPFINGETELQNAVDVTYLINAESSGVGDYTFTLPGVDSDHPIVGNVLFEPVVEYPDPIHSSQFISQQSSAITSGNVHGDYYIDPTNGQVTVRILDDTELKSHRAKYRYEDLTSGVDKRGLYSIDYENGVVHFASGTNAGVIYCNVTMYSVFYNMGEVVSEGNIKEISEEGRTIEMRSEYGIRFLANDSPRTPRPRFVRVGYEYYDKTTESLKDLEPYFSPICKDVAVRAITKDMIGDL